MCVFARISKCTIEIHFPRANTQWKHTSQLHKEMREKSRVGEVRKEGKKIGFVMKEEGRKVGGVRKLRKVK